MRKRICALMMTLVLLTGCSRGGQGANRSAEELALSIRAEYLAMTAFTASADIKADYGQRVYEYSVNLSWMKDGDVCLTVTAPEDVSGITARIQNGMSYLEFDGVSLETGVLSGTGLSPIEAIPALMDYLLTGYIAVCDFETVGQQEVLWFCCRDPEGVAGTGIEAEFWFDKNSHALQRTEILSDGYCVIQCIFYDFVNETV